MDEIILGSGTGGSGEQRGSPERRGGSRRAASLPRRLTPSKVVGMLLAMLMISGLCPLIPAAPAGAATAVFEQLPKDFMPSMINNNRQVVGTVRTNPGTGLAIYTDGDLDVIYNGAVSVLDFNDKGEVLFRISNTGQVMLSSDRGLEPIEVPTSARNLVGGYGPDKFNRLLGIGYPKAGTPTPQGYLYSGSTSPSLITELATAFAMNKNGVVFGTTPDGVAVTYKDGEILPIENLSGRSQIHSVSDNYAVISNYDPSVSNAILWFLFSLEDRKLIPLPGMARAVNNDGVYVANASPPSLGFPGAGTASLENLLGGLPSPWTQIHGIMDLNDRCDVVALGSYTEAARTEVAYFIAPVAECNPETLDGEFYRSDGGLTTFYLNEEADLRLRIFNVSGVPVTNVQLVSVISEPGPFGGEVSITEASRDLPSSFTASGEGSYGHVDFKVRGEVTGEARLTAVVSGMRGGKSYSKTIVKKFAVRGGLAVEINQANSVVFGKDNNGDGVIDDEDTIVELTAKVTNNTEDDIIDIGPDDLAKPLSFRSRLPEHPTAALEPHDLPKEKIAKLEPGASETLSYKYKALDLVSADVTALFFGTKEGQRFSGVGKGRVNVGQNIWAEVSMNTEQRPYRAGQTVRLTGKIKNVTKVVGSDGEVVEEGFPVGVLIEPKASANAGGGFVFPASEAGGRTPTAATGLLLEAGEEIDVGAILATIETDAPSNAEVSYDVTVWSHDVEAGEDPVIGDESNVEWKRTDGSSDSHTVTLDPVAKTPPQPWLSCPTELTMLSYIDCRLVLGMADFVNGNWELLKLTVYGAGQIVKASLGVLQTLVWTQQQMVKHMLGDEQAMERLAQEIIIDLRALQQVGVESLQGVSLTVQSIVPAIATSLRDIDKTLQTGDLKLIVGGMAEQVGKNSDAVVGLGSLVRKRVAAKSLAGAAGAEGAVKTALTEAIADQRASLKRRVDDAYMQGKNITRNNILEAGDDVTDLARVWRDSFGLSQRDVETLLKIAKDEDILMPLRSRSPRSASLLERGEAYPKPHGVSIKTVNETDRKYLGYLDEWDAKAVLVEPPVAWHPPGPERDAVINAYLDRFGDLTSPSDFSKDLRASVQNRLEARLDEWPVQLQNFSHYAEHGIDVNFYANKNGISEALMPNNKPNRAARVTPDELGAADGVKRRAVFHLEMAGPNGGAFRGITGDVDFLGIFHRNGEPVTNIAKRRRVYKKMQSLLGMQHGESFTFADESLRPKFLGCCTEAGEAMLTPTPEGKLVATYFDDAVSVLPTGPNASVATTTGKPAVALKGVVNEVESAVSASNGIQVSPLMAFLIDFAEGKNPAPTSPKEVAELLVNVEKQIRENPNFNRKEGEPLRPTGDGGLQRYQPGDGTTPTQPKAMRAAAMARAQRTGPETLGEAYSRVVGDGYEDPFTGVGAEGGTWVGVDPNEILDDSDQFQILPLSYLYEAADPGDDSIEILGPELLRMSAGSPFFVAGDKIVIDPGAPHEETVEVAEVSADSLRLTKPLARSHGPSAMVLLPTQAPGGGTPGDGNGGDNVPPTTVPSTTSSTAVPGTSTTVPSKGGMDPKSLPEVRGTRDGTRPGTSGTNPADDTRSTPATGRSETRQLPYTGGSPLALLVLGTFMVLSGVALIWSRRRRRLLGTLGWFGRSG